MRRLPPGATLFPYTTLFRSGGGDGDDRLSLRMDDVAGTVAVGISGGDGKDVAQADFGRPFGAGNLLSTKLEDRKSTRLNSSHTVISYAVFCLKKKNQRTKDR